MDYVKVDWCGGHLTDPEAQHTAFSKSLNATGRPIWLELCRGYKYDKGQIPSYVADVRLYGGGMVVCMRHPDPCAPRCHVHILHLPSSLTPPVLHPFPPRRSIAPSGRAELAPDGRPPGRVVQHQGCAAGHDEAEQPRSAPRLVRPRPRFNLPSEASTQARATLVVDPKTNACGSFATCRNYGDFLMTGGPGCNVNETLHCPRSSDDEYRTVRCTGSPPLSICAPLSWTTALADCFSLSRTHRRLACGPSPPRP